MANVKIGIDIDAKISNSINSQLDALENKFSEIQSVGTKGGFGEKIKSEVQSAKAEVSQLREEFNDLYSSFKSQKLDASQFDNFVKSMQSSIAEMNIRVTEAEESVKKLEIAFKAGQNSSLFEKRLDTLQNKINSFVEQTQAGISALIDFNNMVEKGTNVKIKGDSSDLEDEVEQTVSSFTFKDGGVKVPVTLDKSQLGKLKTTYDEIVGMLQKYADSSPVDVTMRLFPLNTTKAGAKEVTEAVKNVQAQIADLPEGELKTSMNSLYGNLEKQYQKALRLKIDVDLGETQASLKQRIKELNDTVKAEGFTIYPDFDISDEESDKISAKLTELQEKLTLSVTSELTTMSESLTNLFNTTDVEKWSQSFISSLDSIQAKLNTVTPLIEELKVGVSSDSKSKNLKQSVPDERDVNVLIEFTNAMKALRQSLEIQQNAEVSIDIDPIMDKLDVLRATIAMVHSGIGNLQGTLANVKSTGSLQIILETLQKIENAISEINSNKNLLDLKINSDVDVQSFINDIESKIKSSDGVKIPISVLESSIDDFITQIQFAVDSRLTNGDIGNDILTPTSDNDIGSKQVTSVNTRINNLKDKIESTWESWYIFAQGAISGTDTAKEKILEVINKIEELSWALRSISNSFDNIDFSNQIADLNTLTQIANINNSAINSADSINREAQSLSDVYEKALKAAEGKREFSSANQEVLTSIINSLSALNSEGDGFNNLNKIINNLANNKNDRITDMIANLELLRDTLTAPVDDNSFIKAIEEIANQGDNLKDLATILKASQQQLQNANNVLKNDPTLSIKSDKKNVISTSDNLKYDANGNLISSTKEFTEQNEVGRKTKYTEKVNNRTGEVTYNTKEITNYQEAVESTSKSLIRQREIFYELRIEREKTNQDDEKIRLLQEEYDQLTNIINEASNAAVKFNSENRHWVNDTVTGSKYLVGEHYWDKVTSQTTLGFNQVDQKYNKYFSSRLSNLSKQVNSDIFTVEFEIDNGKHTKEFNNELEEIHNNLLALQNLIENEPDLITEQDIEYAKQYNTLLKQQSKNGKLSANKTANENSVNKSLTQINKLLSENTRMSFRNSGVADDLRILQSEFKNFDTSRPQSELDDLNTRLLKVKADFEELPESMKGMNIFQQIGENVRSRISQLVAQYLSFQDIIRYVRSAATTIIDLDAQLVDLRKTTTMTTTELNQFYSSSSNIAKQLGVTTSEIISQASAWSRLGYSSKEAATEMAKLSSQFASISPGMDTESSTDYLVSSMQAFGIEVDDVQRKIMDNVNAIGNTMATSNSEIGEMLERSSAAMKAANNTIEETIALESAAVEITRNAETTGTAFRTISMRIRGYDEETEELSEDLENIAGDIADLTKIKGKGGISIFSDKDKTEYKSTYQILKEISAIWDELTDKQQANLLEKLGGKRGAQSIAGLLDDFSSVEEAMQTMENAAGSSEREMDIIRDSLEFKINALKETWVGILQEFADRGALGGILDTFTAISEAVGDLTSNFGLLQTALVGIGSLWGTQNLGLFSSKNGKVTASGNTGLLGLFNNTQKKDTISYLEDIQTEIGKMTDMDAPLSTISSNISNITDSADGASNTVKNFVTNLTKSKSGAEALADVENEIKNVKKSAGGLKTAATGVLATLGNFAVSFGISTAISLAVEGFQRLINSYDDLMEKVNEYTREYSDQNKQLNDYSEQIKSLRETMESSTSTTSEVADATSQLYTIQNDLISTYGSYASGLDLVNGKLETQLDLLNGIDKANLSDTIDKIENERTAKESSINLAQNLGLGFLSGGFTTQLNEQKYIGELLSGTKELKDWKDIFLGEDVFGVAVGDDVVNNLEDIKSKVKDYQKDLGSIKIDKDTQNFIEGLQSFSIDSKGKISISGDVNQVKKDIRTLQELMTEAGVSNENLNKALQKVSGETMDIIEQNMDAYNDILLNEIVNGSNDVLKKSYNDLNDAYQRYQEAIDSGDTSKIQTYTRVYAKAFNDIKTELENSGIDTAFVDYFEQMHPELQNAISDWNLKEDLEKEFELEWDLSKYIKNTDFEELKSDYFRVINAEEGTIAPIEQSRWEKLTELAAEHNYNVVKLLETYKALNDEMDNPVDAVESLSIVPPTFETISNALSEQKENGTITNETLTELNNTYGSMFDGFDSKAADADRTLTRINKQLAEMQKGGNVNLKLRPEIDTSELEKAGWESEDGLGSFATVYTNTFSNEEETKYLNFTPIIVDPDTGEYKGTLTPDELTKYAEDVITGVRTDDLNLQIGTEFSSVEDAENAAKKIHRLHEDLHTANENLYQDTQSTLYTFTENGVLLNTDALTKYNDAMADAAMASAELKEAQSVKEYQKEATILEKLVGTQGNLRNAYNKGKDALKSYLATNTTLSDALKNDISASMERLETLSEEINKYDMLEAQIRATTSTLNEYVEATSTANEKDNFDTATSMVSSIKEAFENGWTGTDEFKKGIEYLAGYDFDTGIMEFGENYDSTWADQVEAYITRAEKYFTEDISGIYNFLDDAVEKTQEDTENFITKSAEGIYTINIDNIDQFAEKMDMSVSSVMDLLLATDEAWDFDIDFSSIEDGIVDGLHAISEDSVDARTNLEEIGETLQHLEDIGYDSTAMNELWAAYDKVAEKVSPDIAIDEKISTYSSDSIKRWADSIVEEAKGDISGVKIDFDADIEGLSSTISELQQIRESAKIKGEFDETEFTHASVVLQALLDQKHSLEAETVMNIDTSGMETDVAGAVSVLQQYVTAYQDLETAKTLNLDSDAIDTAQQKVDNLQYQLSSMTDSLASIDIDTSMISVDADPEQLYNTLIGIDVDDKVGNNTVTIDADDTKGQQVLSGFKNDINGTTANVQIGGVLQEGFSSNVQSAIDAHTYTIKATVSATPTTTGGSDAEGGSIKATTSNNLVGELGQEIVARNGRYFTVGDNGAEIVPLEKGDIVFNAQQTAELLRNGRINSRGKLIGGSFVSGTLGNSYASGKGAGTGNTAGSDTWKKRKASSTSSSSSGSSSSSSDSTDDTEDETEETFDWVEVAIQRIEEELARLEEIADSVYETWATRNEWVRKEIDKTTEEIELQTRAAQIYLDKANSIGLEAEYAEKIQNGEAIDINSIETIYNDDDLVDRIQDYQTWYEKYIEAYDQIQTLGIQLQEYYKELFDNIQSEYDDLITNIEKKTNIIEERITRTEEHGFFVDQEYYDSLLDLESRNEAELVEERAKLISSLNEAVKVGNIKAGSEAWNEMYQEIEDVNKALEESATNVVKLNNEIRQLNWDKFDWVEEQLSDISEEADFLITLLQGELNIDDNGNFNNRGFAQAGLIGAKYDDTLKEAQRYKDQITKINAELEKDENKNDKNLIARKNELVKAYRSSIEAAEDEKQAMKSLVEEAI